MVLKLLWSQKRFRIIISHFFAIFCMTKLKPFSGKAKQSLFKPKFCTRDHFSSLEVKNECSESLKIAFSTFCKFLNDRVETISWESRKKRWKIMEGKVFNEEYFWKWFSYYLQVKTNVLSVQKCHFSLFCKCLNDKVKTVFWKSEAMPWKLIMWTVVRSILEYSFQLFSIFLDNLH